VTRAEWGAAIAAHRAAVGPWVEARVARRLAGTKHPVHDFLFEYYSFKPSHLLRWSPGLNVTITSVARSELDWPDHFAGHKEGWRLDPGTFPARRREYLAWAVTYLEAVAGREAYTGCFGLHEWAMVYREPAVRHSGVPLRLGRAGTDAVVEAGVLRCSHFDAFRFFTPDAVPRNRVALTRADATRHDQPGCVHANMDLYKFAMKVAPFVSAATTAAAFGVAVAARELDMRASPYDLAASGFPAVPIETASGREEYAELQRGITARAAPVRAAVLAEYRALLAQATAATQT